MDTLEISKGESPKMLGETLIMDKDHLNVQEEKSPKLAMIIKQFPQVAKPPTRLAVETAYRTTTSFFTKQDDRQLTSTKTNMANQTLYTTKQDML